MYESLRRYFLSKYSLILLAVALQNERITYDVQINGKGRSTSRLDSRRISRLFLRVPNPSSESTKEPVVHRELTSIA